MLMSWSCQCSVRPARLTTARMGTCALYSSAHLNRDSLGSEPRSCVLLSGVRYKRPLANTCGAPSGRGREEVDSGGHGAVCYHHSKRPDSSNWMMSKMVMLDSISSITLASSGSQLMSFFCVDHLFVKTQGKLSTRSPGSFCSCRAAAHSSAPRIFFQAFARAARPRLGILSLLT
jgi:hypothetical protein